MSIQQMMMSIAAGGAKAPVGLIVAYTDAGTPTNWTNFSSADGKFLVGAGTSYSAGGTGGSNTASISGSFSNTGSHTGNSANFGQGGPAGNSSAGSHSHNLSVTATTTDVYKDFRLIKCTAESKMPANAVLFAASSLTTLSNIETSTDRFVRANSSYGGTGGSSSISGSGTTDNTGSHQHPSGAGTVSSYSTQISRSAGAHSHPFSISGSLNTKRRYLSAWTNAAQEFDLEANGIAMWESATPPDGWYICNGANGTPDMRDYFLRLGNTGNHGTGAGDNSAPWSTTTAPFSSPHDHVQGNTSGPGNAGARHGGWPWSHSHNASGSVSVTQPYYALYFVMYAG